MLVHCLSYKPTKRIVVKNIFVATINVVSVVSYATVLLSSKAMMLYVLMLKTFWMLHKIVVSVIIVAVKDIFDDTINVVIKSNDVVFTDVKTFWMLQKCCGCYYCCCCECYH